MYGAEQPPVSEATVDLVLLAALEQFKYQATNRPLLAASEEYEDSGTTQKKDVKKKPAKILANYESSHTLSFAAALSIHTLGNDFSWKHTHSQSMLYHPTLT